MADFIVLNGVRINVDMIQSYWMATNADGIEHAYLDIFDYAEPQPTTTTPEEIDTLIRAAGGRVVYLTDIRTTEAVPAQPPCHWWDGALHSWCYTAPWPIARRANNAREIPAGDACPVCEAELPEGGPPEDAAP